jgi:SGNH hydrolase-like domain, acetyltransferase AlgX
MLSVVRRTITLPDEGPDSGAGSVRLGVDHGRTGTLSVGYPDTLELIQRSAPPSLDDVPAQRRSAPDELEALLQQFRDERHRRRSVRGGRALIALFATALLAVWLLDPPASGGTENRAEAAFPALKAGSLVKGSNYRQTDAALRDRLALKQYVVKAIGETSGDKLGTSLSSAVVIGSSGVPFLSEDFTAPCQFDFEPAKVDAGLRALRTLGQTTGKTITVAIAPDKSSILTSELGSRAGALMACSNRVRQATESTWGKQSDPPVMTAWKQLAAAQAAHPGKIFQRGDSHWTSQGALTWSHTLITQLVKQGEAPVSLRNAPYAKEVPDQPADSDLYQLMGISRTETVPVWDVKRANVRITSKKLPSPSGRGIAVFHSASATAAMIKGHTLVVNDSFFSRAEGQLAPYFSDLEVLHWSDFITRVQDGTLPHFDRIILESVQRGWPERAGWLEQGQPVYDALATELSTPSKTASQPIP